MIIENVKFKLTANNALILSYLATYKSAKILVNGCWVSTEKYDIYGAPILPDTTIDLFRNELLIAESLGKDHFIQVKYNEFLPSYSSTLFSNVGYIELKLHSMRGFIDYLTDIQQYRKAYPDYNNFGEYILYGKFLIKKDGSIWVLEKSYELPIIFSLNDFSATHKNFSVSPFPVDCLTNFCQLCPYCLQELTLKDILFDNIDWNNTPNISHRGCLQYSNSLKNEAFILSVMHNTGWKDCNYDYFSDTEGTPHFTVHTQDGEIEMSWQNNFITLKFSKDFSYFPMSILNGKDVKNENRIIKISGIYQANNCLAKVYKYLH